MTRQAITLPVADISAFARHLSAQLASAKAAPSHLALMNMLARAAGFRNFQHLRADRAAEAKLALPAPLPLIADHTLIARAFACFDGAGQLLRWPARRSVQVLCLWGLWSRLQPGGSRSEREISAALDALHAFGDAAMLRRDMVQLGLLRRSEGGVEYARVEQQPPANAALLIRQLSAQKIPAPDSH